MQGVEAAGGVKKALFDYAYSAKEVRESLSNLSPCRRALRKIVDNAKYSNILLALLRLALEFGPRQEQCARERKAV